ncbi:MAG: SsrA-binding protein [Lentimonas sp.]|jgi:SsrA-binding protein
MKQVAVNRKARFHYTIEEEIEAGIMLLGSEVKSLRDSSVNLTDGYVGDTKGELFLLNVHISPFKGANRFNHEPLRPRKLMLHRKQIDKLLGKIQIKGLSLIPLSIYFNEKNFAKVKIGVCKGKKLYDKRASLKEKDEKRRIQREGE